MQISVLMVWAAGIPSVKSKRGTPANTTDNRPLNRVFNRRKRLTGGVRPPLTPIA
jgi:hypothetical protein